ncbi:hypothetical protein ACFLZ7_01195 [Nanoarchaeota archaeon]
MNILGAQIIQEINVTYLVHSRMNKSLKILALAMFLLVILSLDSYAKEECINGVIFELEPGYELRDKQICKEGTNDCTDSISEALTKGMMSSDTIVTVEKVESNSGGETKTGETVQKEEDKPETETSSAAEILTTLDEAGVDFTVNKENKVIFEGQTMTVVGSDDTGSYMFNEDRTTGAQVVDSETKTTIELVGGSLNIERDGKDVTGFSEADDLTYNTDEDYYTNKDNSRTVQVNADPENGVTIQDINRNEDNSRNIQTHFVRTGDTFNTEIDEDNKVTSSSIRHLNGDSSTGVIEDGKTLGYVTTNSEGLLTSFRDSNGDVTATVDIETGQITVLNDLGQEVTCLDYNHCSALDRLSEDTGIDYAGQIRSQRFWSGQSVIGAPGRFLSEAMEWTNVWRTLTFADRWLEYDGWSRDVDSFFSEHSLGLDYYASNVCEAEIDSETAPSSMAMTRTGFPGAHIEGERIDAVELNETNIQHQIERHIYKITFMVDPRDITRRNDDYAKFGIFYSNAPAGSVGTTYETDYYDIDLDLVTAGIQNQFSIQRDSQPITADGSNMIIRERNDVWNKVCIKFTDLEKLDIIFRNNLNDDGSLCNSLTVTTMPDMPPHSDYLETLSCVGTLGIACADWGGGGDSNSEGREDTEVVTDINNG